MTKNVEAKCQLTIKWVHTFQCILGNLASAPGVQCDVGNLHLGSTETNSIFIVK